MLELKRRTTVTWFHPAWSFSKPTIEHRITPSNMLIFLLPQTRSYPWNQHLILCNLEIKTTIIISSFIIWLVINIMLLRSRRIIKGRWAHTWSTQSRFTIKLGIIYVMQGLEPRPEMSRDLILHILHINLHKIFYVFGYVLEYSVLAYLGPFCWQASSTELKRFSSVFIKSCSSSCPRQVIPINKLYHLDIDVAKKHS